ncbi:MAG: hypothetical protein Q9220_000368 [cf. Caloplaca sp. 1 TL-2023]
MQYSIATIAFTLLTLCLFPWIASAADGSSSISLLSETVTTVAITQLLSLFSISLDFKDFAALRNVFSPNAVLDGGGGDPITGIAAIEDFYTTTFQNKSLKTEHTSDTVYAFNFTNESASSTSYATAVYFGPEVLERGGALFSNTSVVFRERFDTQYKKIKGGELRISQQSLTILVGGFREIWFGELIC